MVVTEYLNNEILILSESVLKDGETEVVEFFFPLLPFLSVALLESLLSESLQFDVGLYNFSIHFALISAVHLSDGVLSVGFMPLGVSANGGQSIRETVNKIMIYLLSSVSSEFGFFNLCLLSR